MQSSKHRSAPSPMHHEAPKSDSSDLSSEGENEAMEAASEQSEDELQMALQSSWRHTLLSLLPFTKERRALREVIDAVDNITRLQVELLRARKLVRTVTAGQHELALRQLLQAVNQTDFHYFQKIRHDRVLSGKWVPAVASGKRKDKESKKPNRFRQAVNSTVEGPGAKKSAWVVQAKAFGDSRNVSVSNSKRKKRLLEQEKLPQCAWQPSDTPGEVGFVCKNSVARRLDTRKVTSYCAWHAKACLMAHQDESQSTVLEPNAHGLCSMHHIAKFGQTPEPHEFPLPGMVSTLSSFSNPFSTHPLAPHRAPPAAIMLNMNTSRTRHSQEPHPRQYLVEKLYLFLHAGRRRRAAVQIQNAYRAYVCRQRFKTIRFHSKHNIIRRDKAARYIQRLVRSAQGKAFRVREHQRQADAVQLLQRWWRGAAARLLICQNKAAVVIQRLFQLVYARRVKLDQAAVNHVSRYINRLQRHATRIQAAWRGRQARRMVALRRVQWVSGVMMIQHMVHKWLKRIRRKHLAARVEARRLARAANILRNFYFTHVWRYKPPPEWSAKQMTSVEDIQRIVRGYLGRLEAIRLRATREKLWDFLNPVDIEELRAILFPSNVLSFEPSIALSETTGFDSAITDELPQTAQFVNVLEQFLPARYKRMHELQSIIFIQALRSLYASWDQPLSDKEILSLTRLFRSDATGQIDVIAFSNYAQLQTTTCRRHGRRLCGECIAYTTCEQYGCSCKAFQGKFVCNHCGHNRMKHRIGPQEHNSATVDLLSTLEFQTTPDVFRISTKNNQSRATSRPGLRASNRQSPLLEMRQPSSVRPMMSTTQTNATSSTTTKRRNRSTLRPMTVAVAPETVVPREEFWSQVKNLPSKSIKEYEATVAQSMPAAFVQGSEVVYTLDAGAIYVHILRELQRISEHIRADDSVFLRLVLRYAKFFERHWRKFVRDIRLGTLNPKLVLSVTEKQYYLASAVAQPRMANQLDRALRSLGFHARVATKETTHVEFAALKYPKENKTRERRHSAPCFRDAVPARTKTKLQRRMSTGSIYADQLPDSLDGRVGSAGLGALFQLDGGGLRAVPIEDDGHWLCPYAGCGAKFKLQHSAFLHLATHNWKRALQVPNPQSDQFLATFWPMDVPWMKHAMLKRFRCTTCKKSFKSPQQLAAHRRMEHTKRPTTFSRQSTKWQWIGSSVLCPPFEPPSCAPLVICTIHRRSRFRCATCVLSNKRAGLQPPLRYYNQIQMRLPPEGKEEHQREFCWLTCNNEQGVVVRWPELDDYFHTTVSDQARSQCNMSTRHCRLLALCEDSDGQAWMAVLALHNPGFTFNPMQSKADRHCELHPGDEVRYLPVTFAMSYFHLVECDTNTFHQRVRDGNIPPHNSRYLVPYDQAPTSPLRNGVSANKQLQQLQTTNF